MKVSQEYGVLPRWDDCHGLAVLVPVPDCLLYCPSAARVVAGTRVHWLWVLLYRSQR